MIGLIDIGGTKLLAAVAQPGGVPERTVRRDTPRTDPIAVMAEMLDEAREGASLDIIAMAVPGPFDRQSARLINPPGLPEAFWNLDLRGVLGDLYDCTVVIENDANCAAIAEANVGVGRGHRTVAYVTVSTGIGTGFTRDGALIVGRHDTEGGHMVLWPRWLGGPECECGAHGCLETLASGRAIERRFGAPGATLDDDAAWEETGRWLGLGVVNITSVIDPDIVIFGGGVCHQWDRFAPTLERTVADELRLQPAPHIARGELGEDRNLHGALSLVRHALQG